MVRLKPTATVGGLAVGGCLNEIKDQNSASLVVYAIYARPKSTTGGTDSHNTQGHAAFAGFHRCDGMETETHPKPPQAADFNSLSVFPVVFFFFFFFRPERRSPANRRPYALCTCEV